MIAVGFEPTKHIARDLESLPFDRSGTLPKEVSPGFEPGSLDSKSKVLTITPRDHKVSMAGFEPATFRLEV